MNWFNEKMQILDIMLRSFTFESLILIGMGFIIGLAVSKYMRCENE